jgi:hypothetical protein
VRRDTPSSIAASSRKTDLAMPPFAGMFGARRGCVVAAGRAPQSSINRGKIVPGG